MSDCVIGELGLDGFIVSTRQKIEDYGHAVIAVTAVPTFAYTVGRWDRGLPEVIVFGLRPEIATALLNDLLAWDTLPSVYTRFPDLADGYDTMLWPIEDKYADEYLCQASVFSEHDIGPMLQLLVPDRLNRLPTDADFDPAFGKILPLLDSKRPNSITQ